MILQGILKQERVSFQIKYEDQFVIMFAVIPQLPTPHS